LEKLNVDYKSLPNAIAVGALENPAAKPPPNPAVELLVDLLRDRDRDVRLAAANAFTRLRDRTTSAALSAALRDPDCFVRAAAQSALALLN